jgi:hypothetical protein
VLAPGTTNKGGLPAVSADVASAASFGPLFGKALCHCHQTYFCFVPTIMAVAGLGGASMAAPVVGDHAEALTEEEQHLRVPIIGRHRPAVAKHDGLIFAQSLKISTPSLVVIVLISTDRNALNSRCKFISTDDQSPTPQIVNFGRFLNVEP